MDLPEDFYERFAEARRKLDEATAEFEALQAMLDEAIAGQDSPERRRRDFRVIEGGAGALVGALGLVRQYPKTVASAVVAAGLAATVVTLSAPPPGGPASRPPRAAVVTVADRTTAAVSPPSGVSSTAAPAPAVPVPTSSARPRPVSLATAPATGSAGLLPPLPAVSVSVSVSSSLPSAPSLPAQPTLLPVPLPSVPGAACPVNPDMPPPTGICAL